ncbi:hypothetical protein YC2023_050002 [Brassica napus]
MIGGLCCSGCVRVSLLTYLCKRGNVSLVIFESELQLKIAPAGPLLCGKPTLASTSVPARCNAHFQKLLKLVVKALKDAGHNVSSTSKAPPKLHVIVAAFVHHIQSKRKYPPSEGKLKSVVKEENISRVKLLAFPEESCCTTSS